MKKILFILLLLTACATVSHSPTISDSYVEPFRATCAIVNSSLDYENIDDIPLGGTGVLLNTGYVITAAHVVDYNLNGKIEPRERVVHLKFYYPKVHYMKGRVVFLPKEPMRPNHTPDFAIIAPYGNIKSTVHLITNEDYQKIKAGDSLYTIGRTYGDVPNITKGNRSTDISEFTTHRACLPIWMGNSGGGVFSPDGSLLGVISTMKTERRIQLANWVQYTPGPLVRKVLKENGVLKYIQ